MATSTMARVTTVVTGVAGSPYYLSGHFEYLEGGEDALISAWHGFTADAAGNLQAGSTWTTGPEIILINPVNGETVGVVSGDPEIVTGTNADAALPPATQLLVRWRTGVYVAGREIRGRTSIPCQLESLNTIAGRPDPSHRAAVELRAETLVDSSVNQLVVWSKKNGRHEPVEFSSVWNEWSVLRSRRD